MAGLCLAAAVLGGPAALAQTRLPAPSLPCASVAGAIQAKGAVVVATGPFTYERVVRDQGFCELETTTAPAYVPSADLRLCFAGYRCRPVEHGENRSD